MRNATVSLGTEELPSSMQVGLILYVLLAALMVLALLAFFACALVALRCRRKNKVVGSEWVTSASIEHLRFEPPQPQTSPPYYAELEEYFQAHNVNRGTFYSEVANYAEPTLSPSEMEVIENKSRHLLQTFPRTFSNAADEPKFIYWETRV